MVIGSEPRNSVYPAPKIINLWTVSSCFGEVRKAASVALVMFQKIIIGTVTTIKRKNLVTIGFQPI